ncbi:MAG: GAF domain-containing protein [Thermoleophilaceae bacterium]
MSGQVRDPWLAIDARTPPALRAREVRRDWERFVSGGPMNGVRAPVADSWRRSLEARVDPSGSRLAPVAAGRDEALARWEVHPLAEPAPLIRDRLASIANESQHLVVVSDADGVLLQLEGSARVRSQAADSMNFTEGALWSETGAGTNAVGTALATDHPVQIFAAEHFIEVVQAWTCSAAPVHDPVTGELLGVIDLTGLERDVHPHSLAVAISAARAVEAHLRSRMHERDHRLRARYEGTIRRGRDWRALVAPTGRLVAGDARGSLRGMRLEPPPGGGEFVLPSGARAFAEPVGDDEAFIVRELARPPAPRRRPGDTLHVLAEERAALRRVGALVASGVSPHELFAAVAQEVGQLLGVSVTHMARYSPDRMATGVGSWSTNGAHLPVGTSISLDETSVTGMVFKTGRPARVDAYDHASDQAADLTRQLKVHSSVGAPIVVEGRLWGVMVASLRNGQPLPADTESRIAAFTELVATAISNTEARVDLARLAEEQAALRHVATLVAQGVAESELFDAVAEEAGTLLRADLAVMTCYESDDTVRPVAGWTSDGQRLESAHSWALDRSDLAVKVLRTGRPARTDKHDGVPGRITAFMRDTWGSISGVGSPIVVEGRVWGALFLHSNFNPLPADTESRLESFTELVATAISNMQARSELAASRARIAAGADEERRRVVRDLHDGAQQRLVHTILTLQLARQSLHTDGEVSDAQLAAALEEAEQAMVELRELAHGILPAALTRGGLGAGVESLASRMPVPVESGVSVDRLPSAVEATAYFVVAEALTNVAKHARARSAQVTAAVTDGTLRVQVRDDGVGGARADGSGFQGLADRLAALDGSLRVESPPDGGTLVAAAIPLHA